MTNEKFYLDRLDAYGNTPQAVGWDNIKKAVERYATASNYISLVHIKYQKPVFVLDVGCGVGLLSKHLHANCSNDLTYFGVDIVEAYLSEARKDELPKRTYGNMKEGLKAAKEYEKKGYLVVFVLLGTYTLKYDQKRIDKALDNTLKAVKKIGPNVVGIVNGYSSDAVDYKDPKLYYFKRDALASIGLKHFRCASYDVFKKYEFMLYLND